MSDNPLFAESAFDTRPADVLFDEYRRFQELYREYKAQICVMGPSSYDVLTRCLEYQFNMILTAGVNIIWEDEDPGFETLFEDLMANKMRVWKGAAPPSPHPWAYDTSNRVFRAVHDYFGHWLPRIGFTPAEELRAARHHALMLPVAAWPALFAETVYQTVWYARTGMHPVTVNVPLGFDTPLFNAGLVLLDLEEAYQGRVPA